MLIFVLSINQKVYKMITKKAINEAIRTVKNADSSFHHEARINGTKYSVKTWPMSPHLDAMFVEKEDSFPEPVMDIHTKKHFIDEIYNRENS